MCDDEILSSTAGIVKEESINPIAYNIYDHNDNNNKIWYIHLKQHTKFIKRINNLKRSDETRKINK